MSIKIEPNRTYPIRSGRGAYVTGVDPLQGKVNYYRVPFGLDDDMRPETSAVALFQSLVRRGATEEFNRFDYASKVAEARSEEREYYAGRAAHFQSILSGALPPESSIFEEVRIEIVVKPSASFSREARGCDFWGHVDSLTGGCCNSAYNLPDGRAYEASMYGVSDLESFLADPLVGEPVAMTLEGPAELLDGPGMPESLSRLRRELPSIRAMRDDLEKALRAEDQSPRRAGPTL